MGYGSPQGYGEGGYGSEQITLVPIVGCTPLLQELNFIQDTTTAGYGTGGYGESGYGSGGFLSAIDATPTGRYWQLSVDDAGELTITLTSIVPGHHNPPTLRQGLDLWRLDVDLNESIIVTKVPTSNVPLDYIPLQSTGGFPWKLTIDGSGDLQTTETFDTSGNLILLPDIIPYPMDVSMSVYGNEPLLICSSCGNASVTASADLSLWCCTCSSFVPPEDTNVIVILDE